MILVTGASGQLGSVIHSDLVDRGLSPAAGTRNPAAFGDLGRAMDFDDASSLDFADIETMVLVSAGYAEDDVVLARHDRVISAAEAHGVKHIVYTSLIGDGDHLGFALAHRWTERRLQESTLDWTILRNGLYAELFGQLAAPHNGVISAPFGNGALAAVAREDLAEVAALVAADPAAHRNSVYELAGTKAITAAELAHEVGAVYMPSTLGETRTTFNGAGLLLFQPAMLLSIFSTVAAGFLANTQSDLTPLLPHTPRSALPIAAAAQRK